MPIPDGLVAAVACGGEIVYTAPDYRMAAAMQRELRSHLLAHGLNVRFYRSTGLIVAGTGRLVYVTDEQGARGLAVQGAWAPNGYPNEDTYRAIDRALGRGGGLWL